MSPKISLKNKNSRTRKSFCLPRQRKNDIQMVSQNLHGFTSPEKYTGNLKYTAKKIFTAPLCFLAAVIIFSLLPGGTLNAQSDETDSTKKVLVLDSYDQTDTWAKEMISGIESAFAGCNAKVRIDIEYMDTRKLSEAAYEKHFENLYNLLKHKSHYKSYDIIIACDDHALNFLLKHRKEIYPETPVVFCGINLYRSQIDSRLEGHKGITGILEIRGCGNTIETALRLHPKATRIVVVNDRKFTSKWGGAGRTVEISGRMVKFVDFLMKDIVSGKLVEQVKNLGEESIVLFIGGVTNSKGIIMYPMEGTALILKKHCKVPIYTIWKGWIDKDLAVGGEIAFSYNQGREAANIAMRIMDGEKAEDIPIMREGLNNFLFDYKLLKKFNISHTHLPENSIILNMPQSFYYKYKIQIYTISSIIAILTVMVIILSVNNLRRRWAEQQLRQVRAGLEIKVNQRTAQLVNSNNTLQAEINERKKIEELLLDSQSRLRSLASELSLSEERLRHKMAIGIHDHIGQNLAISKIKLESLAKALPKSQFSGTIEEALDLISKTIKSARSLSFELSPSILYELGFEAAIEWLLRQTRERDGLLAEFENDEQTKPLADDVRVLLFQGVRELLVNVVKHSKAEKVKVIAKRINSRIQVTVEDNGIGFELQKIRSSDYSNRGFGLFSIQERLGYIGGRLDINSAPGCGTRIVMEAPLKNETNDNKIKELISSIREKKNEHKNIISR